MSVLLLRYIALALLLLPGKVSAQCLSGAGMTDSIAAVQNSATASNDEKIRVLENLRQIFLRCYKAKDSVYAKIVHRLGDFYSKAGNIEKAINYTEEAVVVNTTGRKTEKSFLANSYFNLGSFYKLLYAINTSNSYYDSSINIGKQFPGKYFIVFLAYEQKAYTFFQTADYQKSIETADNGILFAKKNQDSLAEASLLSQKANSLAQLNNLEQAELNIKKAISIQKKNKVDLNHLAASYSIFANVVNKRGNKKAALQYYRIAFQLNKTIGNWIQCSRDMSDMGYLYDQELKDPVKAIDCYKVGLKMLEKEGDVYQKVVLFINMGVVYSNQKQYGKALNFYQLALNTLPVNFTDTSIKSNPSLEMLKLVSNDYYISTLLSNKADALLEQYKKAERDELLQWALATYQLADKAIDMMRWKQYGEQSKLFWRQQTRRMYENAIEGCYLGNNDSLAFFFMEKSRAVLLNDKLNELGAFAYLPPEEILKDQEYRKRIASAQIELAELNSDKKEDERLQAGLLQAKDDFERYVRSLERKYPQYYQYKYADEVPRLTVLQQYLAQNNEAFVHYFVNDTIAYILTVTPHHARLIKLTKRQFNYKQISGFIKLCSEKQTLNNNYQKFAWLSNTLYKSLFQPLKISEKRVIICSDNFLLPFEALCTDRDGKKFLVYNYKFSYVYSARYFLKESIRNSAKGNFLGFAPVSFKSYMNVPDLKESAASIREASGYYKGVKLFTNEQATKKNFIEQVTDFSIVNIFSHAQADSNGLEPLLFMHDSVIHLSELGLKNKTATRLVILTACETNVGKNATGEGIYSLARGFSAAGIPSIAATLWKADEQAIYSISKKFHEYLSQGLRKDDALQQAKLDFMKESDGEKALPYFWANLVLLGRPDPVPLNDYPNKWAWIAGTVIVIVFLYFFISLNKNQPIIKNRI